MSQTVMLMRRAGVTLERFVEERLMPGVQEIGIQGQPEVRFYPVQNLFNPKVPTAA